MKKYDEKILVEATGYEYNNNFCKKFPTEDIYVEDKVFENARIFGDADCWNVSEFFQYFVCDGRLYHAYYDVPEGIELDDIDYCHPKRIKDVTDQYDLD